jgi:enamine deaminase RidA (YjgF/YER057c/UK114 family)
MSAVEDRLKELGLTVPDVAKPVAAYVPALQDGRRIYTSGQLPMDAPVVVEIVVALADE